jgi:hypothetical protein
VTLGLSAEPGGFGQELTLRTPPAEQPPVWGFELLAGVARTLRRRAAACTRRAHGPGEPVDGAGSGLVALGVREDPLVSWTACLLLQVVGVSAGEYGVMGKVGTALVLDKLAARDPLLRTDPSRA